MIGFLSPSSQRFDDGRLAPFRKSLREVGYVEGRNVTIEYGGAEHHYDRLPGLAAGFLRHQAAVIVAAGVKAALAAKAAGTTVPVVFAIAGDPTELGLVATYNRPGGNITGVSFTTVGKQFEALHLVVPTVAVMGCLMNPDNPTTKMWTREAQDTARTLGRKVEMLHASSDADIESAFATIVQKRVGALVVTPDELFNSRPEQLVALTAHYMLPSSFPQREFVRIGGLMSYGSSLSDLYRHVAIYTGRILRGAKPSDLPVVQPTEVELAINLKAAKALGISFPLSLLGRADEVIE